MATRETLEIPAERLTNLRRWNIGAGVLHAASAVAVVVLASDFTLPVTASYLDGPPGSDAFSTTTLWDVPLAWGVALFFILSALAHGWVSGPGFRRYGADLAQQRNYARWVEYALSSSVMIWLIAQVCGIADVTALVAIFAVNACMILFGWLQEKYEVPGEGGFLPFWFGCFAGAIPWLLILLVVVLRPGYEGTAEVPGFVYGIVVSLFVFFNIFAIVQWLQYKQVGRWKDYLVGERTYITLSLVAKSLLAWQVFAGTLAG